MRCANALEARTPRRRGPEGPPWATRGEVCSEGPAELGAGRWPEPLPTSLFIELMYLLLFIKYSLIISKYILLKYQDPFTYINIYLGGIKFLKKNVKISVELDYYEITGRYDDVVRFYSAVSEESRYLRFLAAVRDPASIYSHMWTCGGRTFLVLEGRRPLALVDVVPCYGEAEAGIVVVDSLQRKGYGTRIAEIFAEVLPRLGFTSVKAEIYRENLRALSIARRLGASVDCRGVICTVRLDLRQRAPRGLAALRIAATP